MVAEILGVKIKDVNRWASELGIKLAPCPRDLKVIKGKESLLKDPDKDKLSLSRLSARHGIALETVKRALLEAGIKPYVHESVSKRHSGRPPLPPEAIKTAHMLESWQRPTGMHEHVQELRK